MNEIIEQVRAGVYSVWNRRWLALAVAWGICLLGWLVVALIPNSYESRARIFVQLDDALEQQIGINSTDRKRDIERIRQTLVSAVNLEKVARATRLGADVSSANEMQGVVATLTRNVKVVSQQDNLFEITAVSGSGSFSEAENASLAREVVQKLIDIFREENMAGGRGKMNETLEFMNNQLAAREQELEAAEQRRMTFEAQHPEMVQGGAAGLQRLEAARAQLRGLDADIAAAESAAAAINGQLAGTPQTLPGGAGTGGARGALGQAMADLAGMRSRGLTENHPDVIAAKNQANALRAQVQAEGNNPSGGMPNPAYSSLLSIKAERQANVQSLQARRASAQTDIASLTSQQINNPELAAESQRISRDYDVLKQQYDKLLRDREELRLRGQVEDERSAVRFEIVDPPTSPRKPAAPNRPLLLFGVLFLGLAGGAGTAFTMGKLRSTFATSAGLESALGLPVLGTISLTLTEAGRQARMRRHRQFAAATAGLGGIFVLLLVVEFIQVGTVG